MSRKYNPSIYLQPESYCDAYSRLVSLIDDENKAVWQEYFSELIRAHYNKSVMDTPEFHAAEEKVKARKEAYLRQEENKVKKREMSQIHRAMERPKIDYIPRGFTVDYEKEYARYFYQEVTYTPIDQEDFLYQLRLMERWTKKSIPQMREKNRPDATYAIALELCRHLPLLMRREELAGYISTYRLRFTKLVLSAYAALADAVIAWNNEEKRKFVVAFIAEQISIYVDYRGLGKKIDLLSPRVSIQGEPLICPREMDENELARKRELEEREHRRILAAEEAEREARSVIPLNPRYENELFTRRNIDYEFFTLSELVDAECRSIFILLDNGKYAEASMLSMQLIKSMNRHFVADEYYNYFDEIFSPEYDICNLIERFNKLIKVGSFPADTLHFLKLAWREILESEAYRDYCLPSELLEV